mmetsp:Transcript_25634/g.61619  ORF Transcript_25634/g.61619 Transcript_25634/m.61619 type:complete len:321 (-) Transcript_25634:283-1245(-)
MLLFLESLHQPSLFLFRPLLPRLRPLSLLARALLRLIHQRLELPAPRQTSQPLHAKRQVIVPSPLVLRGPSRALLLLAVKLRPDREHGRIRLLDPDRREGVEPRGEVGPPILHHGHEVEFDLGGGVVRESGLYGVACHPDPLHGRGTVAAAAIVAVIVLPVRSHADRTGLQPVQLVHAPILVRDVRDEVEHVVVVRGRPLLLIGIAQKRVLGPPERIVRRADLVAGSDGLAAKVGGEVRREGFEVGEGFSQHQPSSAVVVFAIVVAPLDDGIGGVEQHAQDGLRGARVVRHLPREEQSLGNVVPRQRRAASALLLVAASR